MRELITPREAARLLGVTRRKLNQLAAEGRLTPFDTVGLHKRFRRDDVEGLARELWGNRPAPIAIDESGKVVGREPRGVSAPVSKEPQRAIDRDPVEPGYLTAPEAAQILGVNAKTVSRWADQGKIPGFKTPGGHLRFAADVIRRLRTSMLTARDVEDGAAPSALGEPTVNASAPPASSEVLEPEQTGTTQDQPARPPQIRVPENLRGRKPKERPRSGLSDSAWRATGISDASVEGHRRAGPTQLYGDDT